jgi:uncharacterized protein
MKLDYPPGVKREGLMGFYLGMILLGLAAGVLAGLAGVGGGIIIVPILVFVFGFTQIKAQGTSLAVLLPPIGIMAAIAYAKRGEVNWRAAVLIASGIILGSIFGAKIALGVPQAVLKKIFGGILLLASLRYLLMR